MFVLLSSSELIDHITLTYNILKTQHPKAALILSGDKNSLDEKKILSINPNFRQIVHQPTRKNKILTIIITDLFAYYQNPVIIPPIPVDDPEIGVPSDHNGVMIIPITSDYRRKADVKRINVRPMPDSLISKFGCSVVKEDWKFLDTLKTPSEMVEKFQDYNENLVSNTFPVKVVTISNFDKPFMTEELRKLRRQRQRAYRKGGKSQKYLKLKNEFDKKLKQEAEKYRVKILNEVQEGKRNNSYSSIRKLELGEHFHSRKSFTLPKFVELNLSPFQCAEKLADHFSSISQKFEPISIEKLSPIVQQKVAAGLTDKSKPVLEEWQVHKKIVKTKKPNSIIPGDLPVKLVKEFSVEYSSPICRIFNNITQTAEYPRQWVVEFQTAIPKSNSPLSEDDTRNISSTAFFSKVYESFIGDWIFP